MKHLWMLLMLLVTPALADSIQVIPLNNRTVEEIVPIVSPLLKPGEAITGTGYKLILRASPQTIKDVERILSKLDKGLHNLMISVRQGDAAAFDRGEAAAGIRIDSETGTVVSGTAAHDTFQDDWGGTPRVRVLEGKRLEEFDEIEHLSRRQVTCFAMFV